MPPLTKPVPRVVERYGKRQHLKANERMVKLLVRKRDRYRCRWPDCEYRDHAQPLDCAHLVGTGMGGDPKATRMVRENLMLLCRLHHQGPISLHSGDLKVQPLTDAGTDGPCRFLVRGMEVGRELAPCLLERT